MDVIGMEDIYRCNEYRCNEYRCNEYGSEVLMEKLQNMMNRIQMENNIDGNNSDGKEENYETSTDETLEMD